MGHEGRHGPTSVVCFCSIWVGELIIMIYKRDHFDWISGGGGDTYTDRRILMSFSLYYPDKAVLLPLFFIYTLFLYFHFYLWATAHAIAFFI